MSTRVLQYVSIVFLLLSPSLAMAQYSVPKFKPNTPARADDVNANFTTVVDGLNEVRSMAESARTEASGALASAEDAAKIANAGRNGIEYAITTGSETADVSPVSVMEITVAAPSAGFIKVEFDAAFEVHANPAVPSLGGLTCVLKHTDPTSGATALGGSRRLESMYLSASSAQYGRAIHASGIHRVSALGSIRFYAVCNGVSALNTVTIRDRIMQATFYDQKL